MTKRQKVGFGVVFALFIIPELLWSPVGNFIYAFIKDRPFRDNAFMHSDYRGVLLFIVLLQFIGISSALVIFLRNKTYQSFKAGRVLVFIVSIVTLATLLVLYALFATKNINI